MYRATLTSKIASETHPDLCFSTERAAAIDYLRGDTGKRQTHGTLHIARVTNWDRIASWDEAVAAWADAGLSVDEDTEQMWYADRADRRAILAAAGFEGMIYDDAGPLNETRHETIRVWGASCWEMLRTEPCCTGCLVAE